MVFKQLCLEVQPREKSQFKICSDVKWLQTTDNLKLFQNSNVLDKERLAMKSGDKLGQAILF